MRLQVSGTGNQMKKPRLVAQREPLRPVEIAAVRKPIQVTKPFAFNAEALATGVVTVRLVR